MNEDRERALRRIVEEDRELLDRLSPGRGWHRRRYHDDEGVKAVRGLLVATGLMTAVLLLCAIIILIVTLSDT